MRFRGDILQSWRVGRRKYIQLHFEPSTHYFTVYTFLHESGWLHHYQCKDVIKAVNAVEAWIKEQNSDA